MAIVVEGRILIKTWLCLHLLKIQRERSLWHKCFALISEKFTLRRCEITRTLILYFGKCVHILILFEQNLVVLYILRQFCPILRSQSRTIWKSNSTRASNLSMRPTSTLQHCLELVFLIININKVLSFIISFWILMIFSQWYLILHMVDDATFSNSV